MDKNQVALYNAGHLSYMTKHTLSAYFPPETAYFYGFPAGENSGFFNQVPAWKEELVAARAMICAGDKIKVVCFAANTKSPAAEILRNETGTALTDSAQLLPLPAEITARVTGHERNEAVKAALKKLITRRSLVMAQPYLNGNLNNIFLIPPELVVKLNDKLNKPLYVSEKYLPEKYEIFPNGREFARSARSYLLPCVVKVSSSSSGDGVRICRESSDLKTARADFQNLTGTILVEKYIKAKYNLGVQFGIPRDQTKPIAIIGHNEQLTTDQGDYLGGVINPAKTIPVVAKIYAVLKDKILPRVRALGWYGIGGFDILVQEDDRFYFIDPNFRLTAAFVYIYLLANRLIQKPLMSFTGIFHGSEHDFRAKILPLMQNGSNLQKIVPIALTCEENIWRMNAGMFFEDSASIRQNAQNLLSLGIESEVLQRTLQNPNWHL